MNSFTNKKDFTEDALYILRNSELLVEESCIICNDVLYEQLVNIDHLPEALREEASKGTNYRFFFSVDDYDYLENESLAKKLDQMLIDRIVGEES